MAARREEPPGSGSARPARTRRCDDCARDWPHPARFCGRCGAALAAGTARRSRNGSRILLFVVLALLLAGLWLAASQLGELEPGATPRPDAAGAVELAVPAPRPTAPAIGRSATCARASRDRGPCGPTLHDGPLGRAALRTAAPATAVLTVGGEVQRFDLPSREPTWRTVPFDGDADLRLRADADAVAVGRPGEVALLDPHDGHVRWRAEVGTGVAPRLPRFWLVDGHVFVLTPSRTVSVLDADTGAVRWSIEDVAPEVVPTTGGLLLHRDGVLGLWTARGPDPVWSLPGVVPVPYPDPDAPPASAPVRLMVGRQLVLPATGETLDVRDGAPSIVRVLGDLTVVLRWPGRGQLEVLALDRDGEVVWTRDDLDLRCCLAAVVDASGDRLVLGPRTGPLVLLDRGDGGTLTELSRPGATLEGVAGDHAIWREPDGLVGVDLTSGADVFHATGHVRALEPLLISGPDGLVHVTPRWLRPWSARPNPYEPAIT